MPKFRYILLLSVAFMCSGYRWRCYAFCDEQTAIQNDYTEERDECRGFAEDNVDAEMAKTANPNSVKARKMKLINLFGDCMAKYGWDVPRVTEKGKMAENDEPPLYESSAAKLAAGNNPDNANNPNEADNKKITEQDLAVRKTPVGNIQKQKEEEARKQENSRNNNTTVHRSVNNKTQNSKAQNDKAQSSQAQSNKEQASNIPNQPATSKRRRTISNNKNTETDVASKQATPLSQKEPAGTNSTTRSTTNNSSNNTTNNVTQKPAGQQAAKPIVIPPQKQGDNQAGDMHPANSKNSAAQASPDTLPSYGMKHEDANNEAAKSTANPAYTKTADNTNNTQAVDSRSLRSDGAFKTSEQKAAWQYPAAPVPATETATVAEPAKSAANPAYTRTTNNISDAQAPPPAPPPPPVRPAYLSRQPDDNMQQANLPANDDFKGSSPPAHPDQNAYEPVPANPAYTRTLNSTNTQTADNGRDLQMDEAFKNPDSSNATAPTPVYAAGEPAKDNPNPAYTQTTSNAGNKQTDNKNDLQTREAYLSSENERAIPPAPPAATNAGINNAQATYPAATTYDSETRQIAGSNPGEPVSQITRDRESVREITSSQGANNAASPAAAAAPPAAAGVILPGSDESAIPTQPRVTKNNSAKQRAFECQSARSSASVSKEAAKKAKECDMECARLRKTLPKTINPAACPVKNSPVNMLDLQLGNRP